MLYNIVDLKNIWSNHIWNLRWEEKLNKQWVFILRPSIRKFLIPAIWYEWAWFFYTVQREAYEVQKRKYYINRWICISFYKWEFIIGYGVCADHLKWKK